MTQGNALYHYIRWDAPLAWGSATPGNVQGALWSYLGDGHVMVARHLVSAPVGILGLGTHSTPNAWQYDWLGPMHACLYDRELTVTEAQAVARFLSLSLSLS